MGVWFLDLEVKLVFFGQVSIKVGRYSYNNFLPLVNQHAQARCF